MYVYMCVYIYVLYICICRSLTNRLFVAAGQISDLEQSLVSSSSLIRWAVGATAISDRVSDCYSNARMWFVSGGFHLGSTLLADWHLPAAARWTALEATSTLHYSSCLASYLAL